jgi:hypothetical protein
MNPEIQALIEHLNETHQEIEDLLPKVDPHLDIYPGWTIRELLAHLSGWDDAVIDMLRAHMDDHPVEMTASRGIDYYNDQSVASRSGLDLEHIRNEWQQTRVSVKQLLATVDEQKFHVPITAPWGETGSVTEMIEIFIHHDHHHAGHLKEWLQDPSRPLVGKH